MEGAPRIIESQGGLPLRLPDLRRVVRSLRERQPQILLTGLLRGDEESLVISKENAILRYKAAMAVFKRWLAEGAISDADLLEITTILARKYGLSTRSIFLENNLLCKEIRGIYGNVKGGQYGQKDH